MTQQGNIVDFNAAHNAASVRYARDAADSLASSMAKAERRRARAAARNAAESGDSSATRSRRSWLDVDPLAGTTTDWQPTERTSSFASSRTDRTSRSSSQSTSGYNASRTQSTVPAWLADAYADLDETKAQSASAFGEAPASTGRSVSRSPRRGTTASSSSFAFDRADLEFDESPRRRSSATTAQRSRNAFGSPTTRNDSYRPTDSPRAAVFDEDSLGDENEVQSKKKSLFSKVADLRKSATKSKAERQFDRQFGGEAHASSEATGPRAAVYKGEMGQQQRYAQRLQQSSSNSRDNGFEFGSRDSYQGVEDTEHTPHAKKSKHLGLKIGAAVFALIICAGAFMYPTVQSYYQTMREHDRLEAEYKAIEERNAALQSSIDTLSSDEGVAAYAHEQYGWIKPGEQAVTVQGLEVTPSDGLENIDASVQSGSIKPPETWYSPFLDKFFGVE